MIEQNLIYFLEFVTVLIAAAFVCSVIFQVYAEWSVSRLIRKMEQIRKESESKL